MIYRLHHIATRLFSIILALFLLSVAVFFFVRMLPGSIEDSLLGPYAGDEARAALRRKYRLDDPVLTQYWAWLKNILQGDLGVSVRTSQPIVDVIKTAAIPSLQIGLLAVSLALTMSIVMGTIAGHRTGRLLDRVVSGLALTGQSVPEFLLGLSIILIISSRFPGFPVFGYESFSDGVVEWAKHLILPVITLSLLLVGLLTRLTRNSVAATLTSDHVRTARSKGLPTRWILTRHVLRPSLIPVVTTAGLQLVGVLGGVILIEVVFSIPGVGTLIVDAIELRDYPVIMGAVLFIGTFAIVVNWLIDVLNRVIDPRLRSN